MLFTAFAFLTTQDKSLRAHSAWQDDPYDVVVSFTQLVVPVLAAAIAARMLRYPQDRPLPVGRVRDLLRGARVAVGAVALTAATDWVAVALGVHASAWGDQGQILIASLAAVTVMAFVSGAAVHAADRQAGAWRGYARAARDPDWVEDLLALVGEQARRWGIAGRSIGGLVDWLQRVIVDGRHGLRRHRVAAALGAATAVGLTLAGGQAITEGVDADPGVAVRHAALVVTIATSGLFAVLLTAGSYLRILRASTRVPAAERHERPVLVMAGFAATASVPVTVAFRDQLGAAFDYPINGIGPLAAIAIAIATSTALAVVFVRLAARRYSSDRS